jgi:DNA polymerase III alpha subunit
MFTIYPTLFMETDFTLSDYKLPIDRGKTSRITRLYPVLPKNTEAVPFDISDYEMLFHDEETLRIIRNGETIGCFYIESPGMRSLLQRLSVDTFEGLTAASSIIRPGVAESGMMQEYIARHKDPRRRKYLVPEMERILGNTYGVMIYQEDVLKVAHFVAGLTLDEADLLRRAMSGKMRSHDGMLLLQKRFFGSAAGKGLSMPLAAELWRQIESFAGYAFCKAHSASFALLSFQVAFLKAHYPAEFMASVLSNQGGFYSAAVYIQECKRLGLRVLLPCINASEYEYAGSNREVRIGLIAIKHLNRSTAERIVEERKAHGLYIALDDFLLRVRPGNEESALLARCGAMDVFGKTRPALLRLLDIYLRYRKILDEPSYDLFGFDSPELMQIAESAPDYSMEEKCRIEYETFDYMVSRHPLEFFSDYARQRKVVQAADLPGYRRKMVQTIGWYMTSKRIKTKKGEIMKFLSLEDLTGTYEAVLFPRAYEKYATLTSTMGPYIVTGRVDADIPTNVIVEKLETIAAVDLKMANQWDSVENTYFGDVGAITEEDFRLAEKLGVEKLIHAYTG